MHALSLIYVLREADGVRQFRITQSSLDRLDVEVVPDARFTPGVQLAIEQGLRQRIGPDVAVYIHHRTRLEPARSGKHACVVSHVA
jgi:phenylacetate-CoA ligase